MGIAQDPTHDTIVVANNGDSSILIFARTANGNVAPLRRIRGGRTGIDRPIGIAVDPQNGEIGAIIRRWRLTAELRATRRRSA
jgi:DNA-binding beta-propeller fold protein YncE